jgi:hypothetical protein
VLLANLSRGARFSVPPVLVHVLGERAAVDPFIVHDIGLAGADDKTIWWYVEIRKDF